MDCNKSSTHRKYSIVGTGITGQSFVRYLKKLDAAYRVINLPPQVEKETLTDLQETTVAISPSLCSRYQSFFNRDRIAYTCDLDIFLATVCCRHVVLVTGTNGKTSTSELLQHCLQQISSSSCRVHVAGNIGYPLLDLLDKVSRDDIVVIEVSSYQLFWSQMKSCHYDNISGLVLGCITSFSHDHLDWHEGFENYRLAKTKIFDICQQVFCAHDAHHYFPMAQIVTRKIKNLSNNPSLSLNIDLVIAVLDTLPLEGKFSFEILEDWRPNLARAQEISLDNLILINDAKATNLSAVIALLTSRSWKVPTLWLIGGDFKGQDLKSLHQLSSYDKIYLAGFGQDLAELKKIGLELSYQDKCFKSLLSKVAKDISYYHCVVLSPGGTSKPYFENYLSLGQYFIDKVKIYHTE